MNLTIDDTRLLYSPTCALCKHLKSAMTPMCDAFPTENGIPNEIWTGKNDHHQPYPGDHDIQFERRKQSVATRPQETISR